jgi:hypothetical protein
VASHGQKVWFGDYSSGNCSGFSPDSLLAFQTKNHNHNANVMGKFLYAKKEQKICLKVFNCLLLIKPRKCMIIITFCSDKNHKI